MARYRSRKSNDPKELARILIVMGCVFILLSVIGFRQVTNDMKTAETCTESTEGVVTGVSRQKRTTTSKKRRRTYYVYVTEYTYQVNGITFSGSSTLSESNRVSEGKRLEVKYNPDDPNVRFVVDFKEDRFGGALAALAIFGIVGIALIIGGINMRRKLALARTGMGYGEMGYGDPGYMKQDDFTRLN